MIDIPIWEKYTLSIEEAASYFRIGENKLRRLIILLLKIHMHFIFLTAAKKKILFQALSEQSSPGKSIKKKEL